MFRSPIIRQRGNRWQIDYIGPDGKRRMLSVGANRRDAELLRNKFAEWLLEGKDPRREMERAKERQVITLEEYFPVFMQRHGKMQSASTQKLYSNCMKNVRLCPELANSPLNMISKGLVLDYLNARIEQHGISGRTANIERAILVKVLKCTAEWGDIDKNPLEGLAKFKESGKRDVTLTCEQAEALIAEIKTPIANIVAFALYSGMRKGNILNLRIEQIEFHPSWPMAMIKTVLKGGRKETIPVGPDAVEVLKRVIGNRTEGYMFLNHRTGRPYVSIHKVVDRAIRRLGLTAEDKSKLRFHDCRYFRASEWFNAGARLEDVQVALGHKSRTTTEKYITADKQAVGARLSLIKKPRYEATTEAELGIDTK